MKTNMYDYICETPDVLTYIINNRKEIVQEFVNEYKDKKIDQIYVIGSGTSYHAGLSALLAPGADAIKATVKEKMELFGSVGKAE